MDENTLAMAEALTRSEVVAGIERVVAQLPKQPPNFNGCCTHCQDPLPAVRLSFGATTCVICQTAIEQRAKMRRQQR